MELNRRTFIKATGLAGAALAIPTVAGCVPPALPIGQAGPFRHGVASGDPDANSVVLWTRVDMVPGQSPVTVTWEVATDPTMATIVAQGTHSTSPESDGTINFVANGLSPATTYYYRFALGELLSVTGRTRTAPTGPTDHLRFGVVSCSNYAFGNFHLYGSLAQRPDLDAIIHLGDYLYEYATVDFGETYGEFRTLVPPHEILSLSDYRLRYSHYRLDPDLQELHRQNPIIHVWDDHEFADDPFIGGASNHQPDRDGDWESRKAAALQAYSEWMPTRLDGNRIHRNINFGDLAQLTLVDRQRKYLFPTPTDGSDYLDAEQFDWLDSTLADANTRWSLLGQQSTFGSRAANMTSGGWGPAARERVHTALDAAPGNGGRPDLVVLGGDIHTAVALDLPRVPGVYQRSNGAGSCGVELTVGSITSPGGDDEIRSAQELWNTGSQRTYLLLDITPERIQGDFWGFADLAKLLPFRPDEDWLAGFVSERGRNHLFSVNRAVRTDRGAPQLAP